MRVLGIDWGRRRTGLALSDPLGLTCTPLEILEERDGERLLLRIIEVAREHDVGEVVVGLPRPLKGGTNRQLETVLEFVTTLRDRTALKIATWDERFTSRLAEKGRSGIAAQDAVAACYMLQDYLDNRAGTPGET